MTSNAIRTGFVSTDFKWFLLANGGDDCSNETRSKGDVAGTRKVLGSELVAETGKFTKLVL